MTFPLFGNEVRGLTLGCFVFSILCLGGSMAESELELCWLAFHLPSPRKSCVSSAEFSLQHHHLNQMLGFSSRHELSGVVLPCLLLTVKILRKCSYKDPSVYVCVLSHSVMSNSLRPHGL